MLLFEYSLNVSTKDEQNQHVPLPGKIQRGNCNRKSAVLENGN